MSVQISIDRDSNGNVVFTPASTIVQGDLVFWKNNDSVAHYPVPAPSQPGTATPAPSLLVQPGATTVALTPAPQPTIPNTPPYLAVAYQCAMPDHEAEAWTLTIQPDFGTAVKGAPPGTTSKSISISRTEGDAAVFEEVDVVQSQNVVWNNTDSVAHFPVPNASGMQVQPGAVTNGVQPAPTPKLPITITYGCAIAGHEAESGTINIYNNFVVVPSSSAAPIVVSPAKPFPAAPVATGGKSPYTAVSITPDASASPALTPSETAPAGSSTGLSAALTAPPAQPGTFTATYQLSATDALGNTLPQQTITVAFDDFALVPSSLQAPIVVSSATPHVAVPVATGGQAPYALTNDGNCPYLQLVQTASPGSGVSIVLTAAPPVTGTLTYQLSATDAFKVKFAQPITINIT